jgi:hypothetical protein
VGQVIADEIGRTGEKPSTRGALIVALLLGLVPGLAALAFLLKTYAPGFEDPDQWQRTAEYVGASGAGTAFAVWILMYFGYVVWRAPGRGFSYLLLLILGLTAGEAIALGLFVLGKHAHFENFERQQAVADVTDVAISQVSEAVLRYDEGGRFYVRDFSQAPGEAGVIGQATMAYMHAMNEDVGRESAQANRFFNAGSVFKKHRLGEADVTYMRDTVATARTAIAEFWKNHDKELATFRANLASAPLSDETRTKVLAAFDDAARSGAPELAELKALDEQMLEKDEALVKAMSHYVSLEGGYANMVDVEDAAKRLNAAIRESNAATDARNRSFEMGMGSSEDPHRY